MMSDVIQKQQTHNTEDIKQKLHGESELFFYFVSPPQVDPPVVGVLFAVSQTALADTKKD